MAHEVLAGRISKSALAAIFERADSLAEGGASAGRGGTQGGVLGRAMLQELLARAAELRGDAADAEAAAAASGETATAAGAEAATVPSAEADTAASAEERSRWANTSTEEAWADLDEDEFDAQNALEPEPAPPARRAPQAEGANESPRSQTQPARATPSEAANAALAGDAGDLHTEDAHPDDADHESGSGSARAAAPPAADAASREPRAAPTRDQSAGPSSWVDASWAAVPPAGSPFDEAASADPAIFPRDGWSGSGGVDLASSSDELGVLPLAPPSREEAAQSAPHIPPPSLQDLRGFLSASAEDFATTTLLEDLELPDPEEANDERGAAIASAREISFEGSADDLARLLEETYRHYRSSRQAARVLETPPVPPRGSQSLSLGGAGQVLRLGGEGQRRSRPGASALPQDPRPQATQQPTSAPHRRPPTGSQPRQPISESFRRPPTGSQPRHPVPAPYQRPPTGSQPRQPISDAFRRPPTGSQPRQPSPDPYQRPPAGSQPRQPISDAFRRPPPGSQAQPPAAQRHAGHPDLNRGQTPGPSQPKPQDRAGYHQPLASRPAAPNDPFALDPWTGAPPRPAASEDPFATDPFADEPLTADPFELVDRPPAKGGRAARREPTPAEARASFEGLLNAQGVGAMLERRHPPPGQVASVAVVLLYDAARRVFGADLTPRFEPGDRFQLSDGRIFRVAASEFVFAGAVAIHQEIAAVSLGSLKSPLHESWDGRFPVRRSD